MKRPAFALFLLLALPPSVRGQAPRPELDTIFRSVSGDGPGCALGVAREGRVLYTRGYGSANLDYGIPITPESVFYLASVSKQFTAAAVALAAREGHLLLDDDVRRWLPELPAYSRPITVRHLVHHTSGLRDYLTLLSLAGRPAENVLTDADLLALIARQRELNFAPGDEYLYSNTGYVLLAEILKRATGRSLRKYAEEKIFHPMGMSHTRFLDDAREPVPGRVIGYSFTPAGFRINHLFNFDKVGDGGLYSSVGDVLKWAIALQRGTLVDSAFVASLEQRGRLSTDSSIAYAFGQGHGTMRGLPLIEHGGALVGFRTHLLRFPQHDLVVAVFCNSPRLDARQAARRVAAVLIGDRMQEPAINGPTPQPPPPAASVPLRDAARFVGSWYSEELDATYRIQLRGDTLLLAVPGRELQPLRATGESELRSGALALGFDADGFLLDAGRVRNLRFRRQPS